MNRRHFLKQSGLVTAGTLLAPAFLQQGWGNNLNYRGKKVIIVQLSGGNDGLNTIVPFTNDIYHRSRPRLALRPDERIAFDPDFAFNKALKPFAELYDRGYISIINNVGYPNPNRSHFRSMDIWHTASGSDKIWQSGWVGRYLDAYCNHAYNGLEVDATLSLALKGHKLKGIAMENPEQFRKAFLAGPVGRIAQQTDLLNEDNQGYLYKILRSAREGAEHLAAHHSTRTSQTDFPSTPFGQSLKTIAELIGGEAETHVYYASLSGFDTHAQQRGAQARLLSEYAEGVAALVAELEDSGHFDDTLIFTFSEFGRRVAQNASNGTDHGAANNAFLIGKNLKHPGLFNEGPNLAELNRGDLIHTVDFRGIYAGILEQWLGVSSKVILQHDIAPLSIV